MPTSYPVFIACPEGATINPSATPVLVESGGSLDIYVNTTNPSDILYDIMVNGEVVAAYANEKVIKLTNINAPKFVTLKVAASIESIVHASNPNTRDMSRGTISMSSSCCGIKNVKLSRQEDGSVVGTVTGFAADVYNIMHYVMSGAPTSINSDQVYRITSWREDGPTLTVTAVSLVSDAYEKIETSAVFKTIPQEIYNLHVSGIISRSMQNPLEAPDSNIYIRTSNIYGTDGWTVQDILDMLKIDAKVPSGFNYHVYQLTVTRGAPIISLLHNLMPVPGLVIERLNTVTNSGSIAAYHISIAKGQGSFSGQTCKVTGFSEKIDLFEPTIIGQAGEPLYIEDIEQPAPTADSTITLNLIGGVFGIDRSITTVKTESLV